MSGTTILTMIETIVGTLMMNPIRMIIRRKIIKEMEAFIKREFQKIIAIVEDLKASVIIIEKNGHIKKDCWFKKPT